MEIQYNCELVPSAIERILKRHPGTAGFFPTLAYAVFSLLSFAAWLSLLVMLLAILDEGFWPRNAAGILAFVFSAAVFLTCAMLVSVRTRRRVAAEKIHPRAANCSRTAPAHIDYTFSEKDFVRECSGLRERIPWNRFARFFMNDDVLILYKGVSAAAIVPRGGSRLAGTLALPELLFAAGLKGKDKSAKRPASQPPDTAAAHEKPAPRLAMLILKGIGALSIAALIAGALLAAFLWISLDDGVRQPKESIHIPFLWRHAENGLNLPDETFQQAMEFTECEFADGNFAIAIPRKRFSLQGAVRDFKAGSSLAVNRQWTFRSLSGPWMISVSYLKKIQGETLIRYSESLHGDVFEPICFEDGLPALISFGPGRTTRYFSSMQIDYAVRQFVGNGAKITESGLLSRPDVPFMKKHGAIGCSFGHSLVELDGRTGRVCMATIIRAGEAWQIRTFLPSSGNAEAQHGKSMVNDMLYAGDIIGSFRVLDD